MQNAYAVPSITRAMKLLELLAQSHSGLTLSEISRKLGVAKSSAHVLMRTLENLGYLKRSNANGKFFFGLKMVNLDLREQAKPFLQKLMLRTGLTVHMAILEGAEAVIVEKVEAPGMLRLSTWVGRRLDANSSGVGKALLAFSPDETFDQFLVRRSLARNNKNTITSPERLKRELKMVRMLGYAFENEEGEIGFRCIGVPLFDSTGQVVAAISVAGTTAQIAEESVGKLARLIQQSATQISNQIGYDPGTKKLN
jgi:DNA-binding IclR family transcriptional regulator